MTLRDWELYYEEHLENTRKHIAERGPESEGPEPNQFELDAEQIIEDVYCLDGTVIVHSGKGSWYVKYPNGEPQMNSLDGKTPYEHGSFSNALGDVASGFIYDGMSAERKFVCENLAEGNHL